MLKFTGANNIARPEHDHYSTPRIAIDKLLQYEKFGNTILEPCCGKGAISETLIENNFKVDSFDLYDWGYGTTNVDFLSYNYTNNYDAIITNPPYNKSLEFAIRANEITKTTNGKVAFLLGLQWLESTKRKDFFKQFPLEKVLVFSKRLPMMSRSDYKEKESSSTVCFAWFIWIWEFKGTNPIIDWI